MMLIIINLNIEINLLDFNCYGHISEIHQKFKQSSSFDEKLIYELSSISKKLEAVSTKSKKLFKKICF